MSNTPIKRKDRKKLNVIDVVIILLLVALVGTAGYSIYNEITKSASSAQSNIVVVFEAQVEDEGIIEYLKKGDKVYFTTDKTQMGVLYDADASDDKGPVYAIDVTESGKIVIKGAMKLVAGAHKVQNGSYYVIDDRNISVGSKLDVYTENAVIRITVKSIEAPSN